MFPAILLLHPHFVYLSASPKTQMSRQSELPNFCRTSDRSEFIIKAFEQLPSLLVESPWRFSYLFALQRVRASATTSVDRYF